MSVLEPERFDIVILISWDCTDDSCMQRSFYLREQMMKGAILFHTTQVLAP
jgi:hypothetical protein